MPVRVRRPFLALFCAVGAAACGAPSPSGQAPTVLVGPSRTTTAPAESPDDGYRCDGTPVKTASHEYCAHTTPRSWASARQVCKANGGDLASFDDPDEAHDLFVAVGPSVGAAEAVWFGLSEPEPGRWTWIDGAPLTASHWNKGEPNNDGGQEHCAEWKLGPGAWNDAPCGAVRPYVCGQLLSTAAAPPTLKCSGQRIHTTAGDYCFHLQQRKTWAAAKTACEAEGSTLAVLSTKQQDSLLHEAVGPKLESTSLWLGFSDASSEDDWLWVTGQPPRNPRWKYGEPNDFANGEDCAEWFPDDGQMNDLDCGAKRPFLCEHVPPAPDKPAPPKRRSYPSDGPDLE